VAETCNDEDDDCDGRTDEDFPLGEECAAGDGICARMGHFLCSADGQGADCDAVPGLPGVELCGNGADDNCDGETDEGYDEGEPCSAGIGGCVREGQLVCTADGLDTECNAVPGAAVDELCGNGVDDDCDDETDEGFALGVGCAVGVGACLRTGSTICAEDGTDIGCDVEPGLPGDELCGNETDDDCNGDTDEGFDVGVACLSGVGSCARAGELVCSEDRLGTVCGAEEGSPSLEVCNELDDDCDGVTDDDCVPVVPVSCLDVLERRGEADSGAFEVDPDGDEGEGAILVYCDMETDGGGWTLFGNVISGGFDYDAFVHPWAGISEADTNKLGVKPADTRARMRVTGAGFHFDVSQTDPSAAFAPSGDDTWSRLVFDTVVDEAGASIRYGAHELLLSTTRTGNGCDIQGSTVRVSGAWASEIGGELYLGASGCGAGSPNYGLLWPIQELEGGTCPHSVRNTMEIGSQNVCDNDATGVFATRLQLFYR